MIVESGKPRRKVIMAMESAKQFDLSIEHVLKHWNIAFAVREIVANALDE